MLTLNEQRNLLSRYSYDTTLQQPVQIISLLIFHSLRAPLSALTRCALSHSRFITNYAKLKQVSRFKTTLQNRSPA